MGPRLIYKRTVKLFRHQSIDIEANMKFFVVVALFALCASCTAEPPRFGSARQRSKFFARQEAAPETTTVPADDAPYPPAGGPYPPSGWKPTGEAFELPTETTTPPTAYGPPTDAYGPPADVYGPPTDSYGPPTGGDIPTDAEAVGPEVEITEAPMTTARFRAAKSQRLVQGRPAEKSFYILLPDNTLQKIEVRPNGARVNTRFNAKILQEVPVARNPAFVNQRNGRF